MRRRRTGRGNRRRGVRPQSARAERRGAVLDGAPFWRDAAAGAEGAADMVGEVGAAEAVGAGDAGSAVSAADCERGR